MATATADVNLELISGPPYRTILRLAMPTVIAMLSQSLVNEIDVVFFSHLPHPEDSNAQAALLPVAAPRVALRRLAQRDQRRHAGLHRAPLRRAPLRGGGRRARERRVLLHRRAASACSIVGFLTINSLLHIMLPVPEAHAIALSYSKWRLLGVVSMGDDDGVQGVLRRHRQDVGAPRLGAGDERLQRPLLLAVHLRQRDARHHGDGRARRRLRRVRGDVDRPRHHDLLRGARADAATSRSAGRTSRAASPGTSSSSRSPRRSRPS